MTQFSVDTPQTQSTHTRDQIEDILAKEDVKFLRLSFTDIMGMNKNVEVPTSQFHKALDGEVMFDGSSI